MWLGGSLDELSLMGTMLHFGDCVAANSKWGAGHTSQRQVAKSKQLILVLRLRSCCNYYCSWEDEERFREREKEEMWRRRRRSGTWGWKQRARVGNLVLTLTSIFICNRFPGKESPGQWAQFTPAQHSEVKHLLLQSQLQRLLANHL